MSTSDLDHYLHQALSWVEDKLTPIHPIPLYTRSWVKLTSVRNALVKAKESPEPWTLFASQAQTFQYRGGRLLLLGAPGEEAGAFLAFARAMNLLEWETSRAPYSATMTDVVRFSHLRFRDYFALPTILCYLKNPTIERRQRIYEPEMAPRWIYALGGIGDSRALPGLHKARYDPEQEVREVAQEAFDQIFHRKGGSWQ